MFPNDIILFCHSPSNLPTGSRRKAQKLLVFRLTLALWHSSVWEVWLATFWKNKEVNTEFRWETLAVAYLGKYIIKNTCSFLEKKRYSTRKRKFVYHFYGNQQREKYKLESLDYESLLFFVQILHPSHVIEVVWVMFILKPA